MTFMLSCLNDLCLLSLGPGGGTPLYGLYRYVRPQRVWFFSRFSHKLGIDFCTLVLNSVFLLEEATSLPCPPSPIRDLPSSTPFNMFLYLVFRHLKGFGKRAAHPYRIVLGVPPGGFGRSFQWSFLANDNNIRGVHRFYFSPNLYFF